MPNRLLYREVNAVDENNFQEIIKDIKRKEGCQIMLGATVGDIVGSVYEWSGTIMKQKTSHCFVTIAFYR